MTLTLNDSDWRELRQQAAKPCPLDFVLDDDEELIGVPGQFGRGYCRHLELCPEMWLILSDWELHRTWMVNVPAHHDHAVQCLVVLVGSLPHVDKYPTLGDGRSYLSGSGINPSHTICYGRSQRLTMVNVHFLPEVLERLYAENAEADLLKLLIQPNGWKVSFFPRVTPAVQQVAQQVWTTPLCGLTRRLYLQEKVFELLALQLQPILDDQILRQPPSGRKPETIARIYHAKEILVSRLENPPALFDLAQQVGISDRTLQRGFRDVFGRTVVGYLIQQRLEQAERLLRQGNCTVADVATQVGYGNMGHFAVAFRRQFGITPSQCLAGKRTTTKF